MIKLNCSKKRTLCRIDNISCKEVLRARAGVHSEEWAPFCFKGAKSEEESAMLLIGNGRVITRDDALPYLADGAVALDG